MRLSRDAGDGVPLESPIALSRVAAVAESLQAAVAPTFGPMGLSRILVDDENRIILTNSGQAILEVRAAPPPPTASRARARSGTRAGRHHRRE